MGSAGFRKAVMINEWTQRVSLQKAKLKRGKLGAIAKIFTSTITKRWGKVWRIKKKKSTVARCWGGREINR